MSESDIDSILNENRRFSPPSSYAQHCTVTKQEIAALHTQLKADPEKFWGQLARQQISWHQPFSNVLDSSQQPHYRWFDDGTLNVSYNCIDRHLEKNGAKTAIISENEQGVVRTLTYTQLHQQVCRLANGLKSIGITKGDRVIIYMPMIAEAIIAMQACARIGAIHSVVFGGFSAKSLHDRIVDTAAKLVITANSSLRNNKIIALKTCCDDALSMSNTGVEKVLVFNNSAIDTGIDRGLVQDRDIDWHELLSKQNVTCTPEWVESEHPLFILYTSGSTGKPKGIQHSSAGYLLGTLLSMKWVFDIKDNDIFWCTADVGWITGHSYVTYGPLAHGATILIYEGSPTYPDGGRLWQMCQQHRVTTFYTAPTAIRALMKLGDEIPLSYDLSSLRLLGTVGEPINPEAWMWYHKIIGKEKCPIVDTWWQTETGSIMIAPLPGLTTTKPGSCTQALPGIDIDIVDDQGNSITTPEKGGTLVIKKPWPSMIRNIWGDTERYIATYWDKFQGRYYVAGDSARFDADGYIWIMGRLDDVINVSGHRLGTMEIESALVAHQNIVEAAVVSRKDDLTGEAIIAFVVMKNTPANDRSSINHTVLGKELKDWVKQEIGSIAKPAQIYFTPSLPKTRSGKIMRRLLKDIANGQKISQDRSTLEDESVLLALQAQVEAQITHKI